MTTSRSRQALAKRAHTSGVVTAGGRPVRSKKVHLERLGQRRGVHLPVMGVQHADVGLGAVRRDPRDRRADLAGVAQVLDGAEAGQEQDGDLGAARLLHRGRDEIELINQREPVVEAGPAQAIAVGDLDDLDIAGVQGMDDGADLLFGELVSHGMGAVAQRGVGEADLGRAGHSLMGPSVRFQSKTAVTEPSWSIVVVMASPAWTGMAAVMEPVRMMWPASSRAPRAVSWLASQVAACGGEPMTAAPAPVSWMRPLRRSTQPSSDRSSPATGVGVAPTTSPPLEALSAMVSSRVMRQSVMRLSMISIAGRA